MGNKLEVVVGRELVGAALKCACACARHATALLGPGENTVLPNTRTSFLQVKEYFGERKK